MLPSYDFIRVVTEDQIQLSGLYQPGDKNKPAVVFIHGFTSDFYSPVFIHSISQELKQKNFAVILAQNRGTGIQTEFRKNDGDHCYLGSFFEKLEDAHLDISAHIEFLLNEGYQEIILMGHSLGTLKTTRYLFEGKYKNIITKLVLLAPFDKNAFMVRKGNERWDYFLKVAEAKIKEGSGRDQVPVPEFEDYPLSYECFVSWYNKTELSCLWDFYRKEYEGNLIREIKLPVQVILGDQDEFVDYPEFNENAQTVLDFLNKTLPNCHTRLLKDSNHTYNGREAEVAKVVSEFVSK